MAASKKKDVTIEIPTLKVGKLEVTINGIAPLIVHNFGAKSIKEMQDKQGGAARMKKAAKVPVDDFNQARYEFDEGDCFRASAIKKAMMNAAQFADMFKTFTAMGVFVVGDAQGGQFIVIRDQKGKPMKPKMRTDMVRVGGMTKVADVRYRPEYINWTAKFVVEYNQNVINPNQIANLIRLAGFHVGLCEGRPQKTGETFGRFELAEDAVVSEEAAE